MPRSMVERTSQRSAPRLQALDALRLAPRLEVRLPRRMRSSFEDWQHTPETSTTESSTDAAPKGSRFRSSEVFPAWYRSGHQTMKSEVLAPYAVTGTQPNKALEPTSTSVMPRAISSFSELKPRIEFPNQARVMPAVAVAHL